MKTLESFTDADFRATILRAIAAAGGDCGGGGVAAVVEDGVAVGGAAAVGAVISGSGLWEWLRLMTAVMARMDQGGAAKPMGMVLLGFFVRLAATIALLYVSLKVLNGSVYALAAGLALGVFALSVEGLRLMKAWTV